MLKENLTLFKRSLLVGDGGLTLLSLGGAWHRALSLNRGHVSEGPSFTLTLFTTFLNGRFHLGGRH